MLNTVILPFVVIISCKYVVAEIPRFRIIAPQLICPKDEHSPIEKPDNTIITIQTNVDEDLHINWTVRWHPLSAPSQRLTVLIWRTVRALEVKLNGPQPERFVYIIDDDELLYGVNYIFNVTASANGETAEPKPFYINNTFGEQTLEAVGGLTESLSVLLVGGQITFVDIEYVLEAIVTTCIPFYNYHFSWKVQSLQLNDSLDICTVGFRMEIPPYSVQAGEVYEVTCSIIRDTTDEIITQIELPFQVGHRGLEVYLGADELIVGIKHGFTVESIVINHDYSHLPLKFHWRCIVNGAVCEYFKDCNESNLIISSGFSTAGQYEITLFVSVRHESAEAKVIITAVDAILPIIQVRPVPRILNEATTLTLVANASNITPTCTLRWYFATEEYLNTHINNTCDECQHGTPITDTLTVFSMDENFLFELIDFTNDTEWREVTAEVKSSAGRARFVVECNCSLALGCVTEAVAYADIHFKLNKGRIVGDITVSPSSGTALETVFRVSSRPAADIDGPLRYSFYCSIGNNNTLLLGSYLEYLSLETLLPYLDTGTEVWVEVVDVRGACSESGHKTIHLLKGQARSLGSLKADISSHIKRCEMLSIQRIAIGSIVTYTNAGQTEALTVFTTFLLDSMPTLAQRCSAQYYEQYLEFINKLLLFGLDTTTFMT